MITIVDFSKDFKYRNFVVFDIFLNTVKVQTNTNLFIFNKSKVLKAWMPEFQKVKIILFNPRTFLSKIIKFSYIEAKSAISFDLIFDFGTIIFVVFFRVFRIFSNVTSFKVPGCFKISKLMMVGLSHTALI